MHCRDRLKVFLEIQVASAEVRGLGQCDQNHSLERPSGYDVIQFRCVERPKIVVFLQLH